jgi:hypothetical protein
MAEEIDSNLIEQTPREPTPSVITPTKRESFPFFSSNTDKPLGFTKMRSKKGSAKKIAGGTVRQDKTNESSDPEDKDNPKPKDATPNVPVEYTEPKSTNNAPEDEFNVFDTNDVIRTMDSSLLDVLDRLFSFINLNQKKPHDMIQGLFNHGIVDWITFVYMEEEDIKTMAIDSRHGTKSLPTPYIRFLVHLKQLIVENIDNEHPTPLDPSIYTSAAFEAYLFRVQRERRRNIYQTITTSGLPAVAASSNAKSAGEKKYDAWNRGRSSRSKTSFDVLSEDKRYPFWKIKFDAELHYQKLEHIVDPNFDPIIMTDSFEKEMWKEQIIYFWTVLLHVYQNPLGKTCINNHLKDRDSRAAYLQHVDLQDKSPAKIYNTSEYLGKLQKLSIATYVGSRAAFITEWFGWLTLLNDNSSQGNRLGFDFARAQLLQAVRDDIKLPDAFTELTITGDNDIDLEFLHRHMLNKATLYDGQDDLIKTGPKRSLVARAHNRQLSEIYGDNDPSAIEDIQEYATYRTTRGADPRSRLPDDFFSTLDGAEKSAWRNVPESFRLKLVGWGSKQGTPPTRHGTSPTRRSYGHEFIPDTAPSTITHDPEFHRPFDYIAKASETRSVGFDKPESVSSGNVPPPSKSLESTHNAKPKLSTLDPAHPASILAKPGLALYNKAGQYQGYLNNLHRWATDDDLDNIPTSSTPEDVVYSVSQGKISCSKSMSLVDRGANGFVGGADCVLIGTPSLTRTVNITGIDNHQMRNVPIATVGAHVISNRGPVICVFNEVAYHGKHQSILSAIQMEHYGITVHDKSRAVGGKAQLSTPDGFLFPLSILNGLPYLHMRPYTEEEYKELPHVIMTSDMVWNPRTFDSVIDPYEAASKLPQQKYMLPHRDYDLYGEYTISNLRTSNQSILAFGQNGQVNFEEYITMEHELEEPITPHETANVDFWVNEAEYITNETIARCIRVAATTRSASANHPGCTNDDVQNTIHTRSAPRVHTPSTRDYTSLQRFFAWLPINMIKETFKNSTQYGFQPSSPDGNLFKRWHSPNPAMNVFRLNDDLLTDKVYSDTPAISGGQTEAQIFFGRKCHIIHVEPISKIRKFIHCLQDFVRKWGAPNRLLGDHAANQSSFKVMDYLRLLWIGNWCSEPYYQHQNMFERRYQTFKRVTNRLMDRTGTPPHLWFLCMCYVAYVFNRVSDPSLNHRQPHLVATGRVADISALLTFQWMEPVYYKLNDSAFPSESTEALGYWVGVAEHVGHSMTYNIWNKLTGTIIHRSSVRTALDPHTQNKRANNLLDDAVKTFDHTSHAIPPAHPPSDHVSTAQDYGELISGRPPDIIYSDSISPADSNQSELITPEYEYTTDDPPISPDTNVSTNQKTPLFVVLNDADGNPKLDPKGRPILIKGIDHKDLKGMTFLHRQHDGNTMRARVIERVNNRREGSKDFSKFKVKYDSSDVEDIIAYNDIMNFIHKDRLDDTNHVWNYKQILGHQGPLTHRDYHYKGSKYNVEIEWENGEITQEPLSIVIEDDPVFLAAYAKEKGLLDTDGWKRLKPIARRGKRMNRLINQAKLRSFRTAPKYMYGFQVPRGYREAIELDTLNNNTRWADAITLEMKQLDDYDTFLDKGLFASIGIPKGFQKIRVHLVFAVKHDGRHKARMCAEGNLTDIPLNSVYAGVVSLRGLRICIFLAELNGMEAYATDIGNAYLEARTQEKVCIKAGPEFGDRAGHLLVIYKALYGLRSSGREFGDLLASCLKELGFTPSLAEPEIFMRERDGLYEYVATYVDDLCLVMKDPKAFLQLLQSKPYLFKLKGSGPMEFHLGCGFHRDEEGILCMHPKKYVDKMISAYQQMFGQKPSTKAKSPLEENDHPELDTSEFLDEDYIEKYQSMVGSLQWIIAIGRWDIQTAVMTLSSFRAQPRKGHLERAKRIYGYIAKFSDYCIKFRVDEPDLSMFNNKIDLDWAKSIYGDHAEDRPNDAPKPLGRRVTLVHYFDANLMHDVLSGKAVTGCVHLANKTPIMWYSKKQATSETATYGAEFVSGRTCIEQVIDLRNTFRYLGVPINDISYVFGDNETMINSATDPGARLNKRHNILSFHFVRSMISRGFIAMHHIRSHNNLSDVLTKHWSYNSVKDLLRPIFHHIGNTASLYTDDTDGCLDGKVTLDRCLNGRITK